MKNTANLVELDDNSMIGRVVAIFPLLLFLIACAYGIKNDSYLLMFLSLLFLIIGIRTLFAKGKIYFDKKSREICRYKEWLWFEWVKRISIENYEYVYIISLSGEDNMRSAYCVNIKKKGSSFLAVDDIRLKVFSAEKRDEAFRNGEEVARITGLKFCG